MANSHRRLGWQHLTTAIVEAVCAQPRPIAFLLWGRSAQRVSKLILTPHIIVESSHPSPLSAHRGTRPFTGSRPFSTANDRLQPVGALPIDWSLERLKVLD